MSKMKEVLDTQVRFYDLCRDGFAECVDIDAKLSALSRCFKSMPLDIQLVYNGVMNLAEYGSHKRYLALYIVHDILFRDRAEASAKDRDDGYFGDFVRKELIGLVAILERNPCSLAVDHGLKRLHHRRPEA